MKNRRQSSALTISAGIHIAAFAAAVSMGRIADAWLPRAPAPDRLVFRVFSTPRATVAPSTPILKPRAVEAVRPLPERVEPPAPRLEAPRAAEVVPPPPSKPELVRPEPELKPDPAPSRPPRLPVAVGLFQGGPANVRSVDPPERQLQVAEFDAPPARAPQLKLKAAATGEFDGTIGHSAPQPGSDRAATALVAAAGFNAAAAVPRSSMPAPAVRDGGFDLAPARPGTPSRSRREPIDTPVEVLFKPSPVYTEEARALKLEGEVLLEVDFTATGDVRVVRIVRGLGHGLDEAAVAAAQGIKFKSAQSGRQAVDFRTTVHIVFRLT